MNSSPSGRRGPHRALIAGCAAYFLAAAALAAFATGKIARSRIAIGVDLRGAPPPSLQVFEHRGDRFFPLGVAQKVPAPAQAPVVDLTVTATGKKNPLGKGSEVWLVGFPGMEHAQAEPEGSWIQKDGNLLALGERQPSTLIWRGLGLQTVSFLTHPWSGVAELTINGEHQTLDLYSASGGTRTLPVPVMPITRFFANVPRSALEALALGLHGAGPEQLSRIYVGTLVPSIFYAHRIPSDGEWGSLHRRWEPTLIDGRVVLPQLSPLERGGWTTFLAVWGLLLACAGAIAALGTVILRIRRSLARRPVPAEPLAGFPLRAWVAMFLPLVAVWSVLWLCFYPGLISLDTVGQWQQIVFNQINDHHPACLTLLLELLRHVWDSPAAIVLVQILALAAVLSCGFMLALRAGAPRRVVGTAYVVCLLFPQLAQMAIAAVKDTPYSIALFALTLMLAHRLLDGDRARGRGFWVGVGALLALAPLLRHNGILITVGMACLLPIFFWREWRGTLWAVASAVLVLLAVKGGLYRLCHVEGRNFSHLITVYSWDVGALVDQDVPLSAEETAFLGHVRAIDGKRWLYSPNSVALTFWGDSDHLLDFQWADAHLAAYSDLHRRLLERFPLQFVRHLMRSDAYLYWVPRPDDALEINDLSFFLGSNAPTMQALELIGHPFSPIFPRAHAAIAALVKPTLDGTLRGAGILWRPALWLYLELLALAVAAWRTRDVRLWLLAAPVLLNTASLVLGVGQEARFQFPVFISMGFLCCLAALPRRRTPAPMEVA